MVLFTIFLLLLMCLVTHLCIRNRKVLKFTTRIINGGYDYLEYLLDSSQIVKANQEQSQTFWEHYKKVDDQVCQLMHKYSYERLLFSFKPLKLENWFTPQEIKILTKHYKEHGER